MNRNQLMYASEEDLQRLAKFLDLDTDGMKRKQIAKLIYWRITRNIDRGMY